MELSHVDSIGWREGGEDSGGIDFGEALEKGSTSGEYMKALKV